MQLSRLTIRESCPGDQAAIERLYASAFPDEDLIPVVRELLGLGADVLSLVAVKDAAVVGHVLFSAASVDGTLVSLLAPLCVTPDLHKQGIGTALVQAGFNRLKGDGIGWVYVLGDPAYYSRFNFKAENNVQPPYPLPQDWQDMGAWQALGLQDAPLLSGTLEVSVPWRHKQYWST